MFFRTPKKHLATFSDRLSSLTDLGFQAQQLGGGKTRLTRDGCAVVVEDAGAEVKTGKPGIIAGDEIAVLVHGGYQMFFRTPSGGTKPALAGQLKSLHAFQEDLREGLGQSSLYNQSLGTTCTGHMYDRVEDRDAGVPEKAWQK